MPSALLLRALKLLLEIGLCSMPLVRSVEQLADGLRITTSTGRIVTVTSADVPANLLGRPLDELSAWATAWLQGRNVAAFVQVTVLSIVPLIVQIVIADESSALFIPVPTPVG